jgi:4-amino-4-deoxy-L-arabinose transferase-like glycosyltransferase
VAGAGESAADGAGSQRPFVLWLVAITVVGVVIRVIYTLKVAPWPPSGLNDQGFYEVQASLVAHGHGFLDPFKALNGLHVASVGHPPFYVVALAGVTTLTGASGGDLRLAGSVFGAVTIVALALLGRRLANDRAGLLAAAIAAVYPMLVTADGALMSETLYGALLALALLAAYRLVDVPSAGRGIVFGVLVGLAALSRGDALLLIPLALYPVVRRPRGWRAVIVACLAVAIVLTPWTIRNESVFHEFLPISSDTTVAGANCPATYYGKDLG